MTRKILPKLLRYTLDEKWQERDSGAFGENPSIRWVVHYEITLCDLISRRALEKSAWKQFRANHNQWLSSEYNPQGAIGELFGFTVCSPAFARKPNKDYLNNVSKAFVQSKFDEESAIEHLRIEIEGIGEREISDIGDYFSQYLDTEEWDQNTASSN